MGKTRNSLCELEVANACIKFDAGNSAEYEKAQKQCEALGASITRNLNDSVDKGIRTAKPKPNIHISHDIMQKLGFDCSHGCPMGRLHVFDGEGTWGKLCMAFVSNPDSPSGLLAELDGDLTEPVDSKSNRRARL